MNIVCVIFDISLPGAHCRVRDTKSGYEFNLSSLKGKDYQVKSGKYIYHLSVCDEQREVCTHGDLYPGAVASCQVDGDNHRIAGTVQTCSDDSDGVWQVLFFCLLFKMFPNDVLVF